MTLNDPRNMKREDIIQFFDHIITREVSHGIENAFRFKATLTTRKKGKLREPRYFDDPGIESDPAPAPAPRVRKNTRKRKKNVSNEPPMADPAALPAPPPLTEQANETITNKYHFNTFPNSSSLSLPNANSFDNWIPLDPSLDPHLDRFPNENYPLPSTLALDTFNFSNFGASSSTPAQPNSFFFSNQEPIRIPASYSTQSNPAFTTNEPHFPAVSPAVTHQAVNQTLFMNESHIPVTPPVTPQAVNQTFMTNEPHIPAVPASASNPATYPASSTTSPNPALNPSIPRRSSRSKTKIADSTVKEKSLVKWKSRG